MMMMMMMMMSFVVLRPVVLQFGCRPEEMDQIKVTKEVPILAKSSSKKITCVTLAAAAAAVDQKPRKSDIMQQARRSIHNMLDLKATLKGRCVIGIDGHYVGVPVR